MSVALLVIRCALAALFAVAAVGKLLDRGGFRDSLREFGVPRSLTAIGAIALPLVEGALAVALMFEATARYAAIAAALLLLAFSVAIVRANARGSRPDCNCFGQVASSPAGPRTLLRNAGLGVAALGIAIAGPGAPLSDVPAVAFVAVAVAAQGWFSWELFRQNGRLLERVRSLEARSGARLPDAAGPQGLGVGEVAPRFDLPRMGGGTGRLRDLLRVGHPVALAFSDRECGACAELPALLERMQAVREGEITIALLVRAREGAQRPGLVNGTAVETLLLEDDDLFAAYRIRRLPSVTVLDESGRVAFPTVAGLEAIEELLATTRPALEVMSRP